MLSEDISQRNLNFESYKERITNFSNEFELGLFIHILRRSMVWIALCILMAMAAAFLYLRYTAPIYESRAVLQLRESNTAKQVLSMSTFGEDKNLQADVELMRSRFFLGRALKRLPLQVSYYNRGQILTEEFYTRSFFIAHGIEVLDNAVMDLPIFVDLARPERVGVSYTIAGNTFEAEAPLYETLRTPHFTCRFSVTDRAMALESDARLALYMKINSQGSLLNRYSQRYQVRIADQNAKTVEILCRDENVFLVRDLTQALAETFIEYDVERQSASAENIIRFIGSQKDTVFNELRGSEGRMQAFKMDNRVADLQQLTPIFLERSREFEDEIVRLTIDIELLKEIGRATDRPLSEISAYDLVPLLLGTQFEQTLGDQLRHLRELLHDWEQMRFEATPEHFSMLNLEAQIGSQKNLLLESVRTLRERAESRRADLEDHLRNFESQFLSLPEKELEYARIQRVFSINEKYYTQLLEREIQYRISKAGFVAENRILEEAGLPSSPISPKRNLVVISYLVAGLVVSLLIVVVRYILHDNITSLHDIAKLSNASIGILGMVPKYKKEIPISQLLIDKNPKSLIAESFRSIRTNLQFVDNSPGPKIVAITSTISGEGKTFVAMNLAGIISYGGKRTIILDLDMRKPKIHLGFGVENVRGMSTLLIGRDQVEDCVMKSSLDGLDFITAGPIPPNPSELINSERMNTLLEELRLVYDVILIDNPPVGLVTDGIPMIQRADYPIYIFRADYSKKQFVQNVDRLINENNISRLSTVLNGVDIDRNKYGYNYGYGYGYGYGQGYGGGYYEDKSDSKPRGFLKWLMGR
ncbi:MAG: polysaccharide biosynthesis tyrosine autokinase [Flavobacteriales bacterium]|nr:polysaccharide biosynthesis tyrosine autokinase [Flavobacteriales bacterium]